MSNPTPPKHPTEQPTESTAPPSKMAAIMGGFKDAFKSVVSPDRSTRRMGVLLIVSLLGAGVMAGWAFYRAKAKKAAETAVHAGSVPGGAGASDPHKAKSAENEKTHLSLGRFTVELKLPADQPRIAGLLNLAELEIEVDCDTVETCELIEKRLVHVRNEVTITFIPMEKEDLLSKDGKQRFLNDIVQRLNRWLPQGAIKQAYISQMVIN